jgi:hypothetical protein
MRPLSIVLFSALLVAASPAPAQQPTAQAAASSPANAAAELEISGPRLIRFGDNLKFHVFLVNRSPSTILFPSPAGHYRPGLEWTITDTSGTVLPPPNWYRSLGFFCPVVGRPPVGDDDFVFLKPGERIEITNPGDPSDFFSFPREGFYRVTLHLGFQPPRIWHSADGSLTSYVGISGSTMSPGIQEKLLNSPPVEVTSNIWTVYLSK